MSKAFRNKKGSALLSVMIMTAILTVFGLLLLNVSLAETKYAVFVENNSQAHYIARAGADAMAAYLIKNPDELGNVIADSPGTGTIAGGDFTVAVSSMPNGQVFIYSEAVYENAPKASVSLVMNRSFGGFEHALFSDGSLDFGNNAKMYGNVGTNASAGVNWGNNELYGNMFFGPDTDENSTMYKDFTDPKKTIIKGSNNGVFILDEKLPFPEIDENDFPPRIISERIQLPNPPARVLSDGFYSDINSSVIFDTGSGSKLMVRVDNIDLSGNSVVTVTGDEGNGGELHLLVTGSISMGGSSRIVSNNGAKVFIYYTGTNAVDMRGTVNFYGIIYAPKAHVDWRGGGNGYVYGSIIANQISLGNSSNVFVEYTGGFDYMGLAINNIAIYRRYEYGK